MVINHIVQCIIPGHTYLTQKLLKVPLEDRYKSPDQKLDRQRMKIGHMAEAKSTNCSGDSARGIPDEKQD